MSERKHTEGPWGVEAGDSVLIITAKADPIAVTATKEYWERHDEIDLANAHLIAAAPEMRAALEPFADQARHHAADAPEWTDSSTVSLVVNIRDLRAVLTALSKARGETP